MLVRLLVFVHLLLGPGSLDPVTFYWVPGLVLAGGLDKELGILAVPVVIATSIWFLALPH